MSVEASCGFDRGDSCRPPIVLVSARPRSNIRAVWHLDEFVVPNVRAVPRVHLFPADFTVRQTLILGHGFVVPNFIYCPAVGAFKSFRHLKNILWLGVGFQTGFDGEVAIAVAQLYLARMLQRILPAGFIAPCFPTKTDKPLARLAQDEEGGCTSHKAGGRRRMGQKEMAMNRAARHLLRHW